mmetsp:Transcript_44245/g.53142  ORF Transcript_44245/g.53142 Transcript_44245/m.53142 type:complete len:506 (+) Transcript_44245:849-2366(+)
MPLAHLILTQQYRTGVFEAALRASGSTCEAVDRVMSGDHWNAFCAVRPPRHQTGPRGVVTCPNDPDGSHGFCLLNNLAVAAAYARSMYRNDGIKRVAIIDFDVHHGNGTEEIVKYLIPNVESSTIRTPFAEGTLRAPKYKPWLDENDVKDVFFASTHGYGPRSAQAMQGSGWFYPASGPSQISDAVRRPGLVDEQMSVSDFLLTQTWSRLGDDARSNCCKIINIGLGLPKPHDIPGMQRMELRDSYRKTILPHLHAFNPDLIFISAGFDAHKRDSMNFGYVGMLEDDYEWVTEQLVKVANTCCNGRIVSVLEGGYKVHGGIVSPFARSVASHLRALVEGGKSRETFSAADLEWESQFERSHIEDRERRRRLKMNRQRALEQEQRRHRQAEAQKQYGTGLLPTGSHLNTRISAPLTLHASSRTPVQASDHNDVEALLKEPLHDSASLISVKGELSNTASDTTDNIHSTVVGSASERKRKRSHVDYKELFEKMKKEESLADEVTKTS